MENDANERPSDYAVMNGWQILIFLKNQPLLEIKTFLGIENKWLLYHWYAACREEWRYLMMGGGGQVRWK